MDYSDGESFEEDYYSDEDTVPESYDVKDDESDDFPSSRKQNYTIWSEADIRQLQEDDVTRLSTTLSILRADSCMLLRHYNWDVGKVHDEWFADEANVRNTVGLFEQPVAETANNNGSEMTCRICFEIFSCSDIMSAAASCGHQFCRVCWRGYVSTWINEGPGCLSLRCPDPSCSAAVDQDMVNSLVPEEDKEKYSRYLLRSYVEGNKKAKWCPAPGCDFAVRLESGSANYDVSCKCGHVFCWNCTEEVHRPVVCETVAKWILKNSSESENTNWILANSKPCPKCKKAIEKNQGCMHMTCVPPCRFEFCWLCLGPWSEHGRSTGGFYACNRYAKTKAKGELDEEERRREMAKNSLERYTHHYERWASNQKSMKQALADLQSVLDEKLNKLRENFTSLHESELNFVTDAWKQIVECRRVLSWTYAYGYYLDEKEQAKRELFEYLQGQAEASLDRLHKCTEKDFQVYFDAETRLSRTLQEFIDFRVRLLVLTDVTRNYFGNLVRALETGLKEVNSALWPNDNGKTSKGPFSGIITYADFEDYADYGDEQ